MVTAPASKTTSTRDGLPASSSMFEIELRRKPATSVSTRYVPAGRFEIVKEPSGAVSTLCDAPVLTSVTVTGALGTPAPELSVILPVKVPELLCANARLAHRMRKE